MSNIPESIIKIIKSNKPDTRHIDLPNLGLNDNDISELQELLQQNKYIDSINLANNNITFKGCETLCKIHTLKKVDLSRCPIADKGIAALIKASINDLNVSYCGISNEGAKLLLENLPKYKSLLIIGNLAISDEILTKIRSKFVEEPKVFTSPVGIDLGLNIHSSYENQFNNKMKDVKVNFIGNKNKHDETFAIYEQLNEFTRLLKQLKEKAEKLVKSGALSHLENSPLKVQTNKVLSGVIDLSEPLEEMEKTLHSCQKKYTY